MSLERQEARARRSASERASRVTELVKSPQQRKKDAAAAAAAAAAAVPVAPAPYPLDSASFLGRGRGWTCATCKGSGHNSSTCKKRSIAVHAGSFQVTKLLPFTSEIAEELATSNKELPAVTYDSDSDDEPLCPSDHENAAYHDVFADDDGDDRDDSSVVTDREVRGRSSSSRPPPQQSDDDDEGQGRSSSSLPPPLQSDDDDEDEDDVVPNSRLGRKRDRVLAARMQA